MHSFCVILNQLGENVTSASLRLERATGIEAFTSPRIWILKQPYLLMSVSKEPLLHEPNQRLPIPLFCTQAEWPPPALHPYPCPTIEKPTIFLDTSQSQPAMSTDKASVVDSGLTPISYQCFHYHLIFPRCNMHF